MTLASTTGIPVFHEIEALREAMADWLKERRIA